MRKLSLRFPFAGNAGITEQSLVFATALIPSKVSAGAPCEGCAVACAVGSCAEPTLLGRPKENVEGFR